jgi:hypothetical protein
MLITPHRAFASPPPCWCGQRLQAHEQPWARGGTLEPSRALAPEPAPEPDGAPGSDTAPDHEYIPADGIESEAFDAW